MFFLILIFYISSFQIGKITALFIVLPVGWLCHSLYFYQLYIFLSTVLTLSHLFVFHSDILLKHPRRLCLEEKSRFGSMGLIHI